jgi:hypothetical protein
MLAVHDDKREVRLGSGQEHGSGKPQARGLRAPLRSKMALPLCALCVLLTLAGLTGCVGGQSGTEGCEPPSLDSFEARSAADTQPIDGGMMDDGGVDDDAGVDNAALAHADDERTACLPEDEP